MEEKIFDIVTPEGAIVTVNTEDSSSKFFGDNWAKICESQIHGKPVLATIKGYQFPKKADMSAESKPAGYVVSMGESIDGFLPGSLAKKRDYPLDYSGEKIVVMVDSFDPLSGDIIIREIPTVGETSLDLDVIIKTLDILGLSEERGSYLHGVIVGETINNSSGRRSGYRVSLNGLEAFLPLWETYLFHNRDVGDMIGTGVLVSVLEIDPGRMNIKLSAKKPYDIIFSKKPLPKLKSKSFALVGWVDNSNVYVFLPGNVLGKIKRHMYPHYSYQYWQNLTGKSIETFPFKIEKWDENLGDLRMLVHPAFQRKEIDGTV